MIDKNMFILEAFINLFYYVNIRYVGCKGSTLAVFIDITFASIRCRHCNNKRESVSK